MDDPEEEVRDWCLQRHGEVPREVMEWSVVGETADYLIRLARAAVVVSLLRLGSGRLQEEGGFILRPSRWREHGVEARRLPGGLVAVAHADERVTFAKGAREPAWIAALLDEWMMRMEASRQVPRERLRRLANLQRERDAVQRMVEQGSLERVRLEVERQRALVKGLEAGLAGEVTD